MPCWQPRPGAPGRRPSAGPCRRPRSAHVERHPRSRIRRTIAARNRDIILRCLEVKPGQRYPTARQLAFDVCHPEHVTLTKRSNRKLVDRLRNFLAGRFWNAGSGMPARPRSARPQAIVTRPRPPSSWPRSICHRKEARSPSRSSHWQRPCWTQDPWRGWPASMSSRRPGSASARSPGMTEVRSM